MTTYSRLTCLTLALSFLLLGDGPSFAAARSTRHMCRPSRPHKGLSGTVPKNSNSTTTAGLGAPPNNGTTNSNNNNVDSKKNHRLFEVADWWEGKNFFDGWDFFTQDDPTHGNVRFLDRQGAFDAGLAYIRDDGAAVMRVDNYTKLNVGQNRNSVRIQSRKTYNGGLFLLDVQNMPHGCSVWPAFWTVGPEWPTGGEIDILEGVHDSDVNQMTLHTAEGCSLARPQPAQNAIFSGQVVNTVCASSGSNNAGCAVLDTVKGSYGRALNAQYGGVFAMLWNDDGIKIWRFDRQAIPDDISKQNPQPNNWGPPKAAFAASSCQPKKFFRDHSIVFDITLCGDWAGATYQSVGCPGSCQEAVANPSNFDNAFWSVNSVIVYQPKH
jgi:hypothetical protein